jgi:formylglycine-generating enzyme required for sulfatase activity
MGKCCPIIVRFLAYGVIIASAKPCLGFQQGDIATPSTKALQGDKVLISTGEFRMGNDTNDPSEAPSHRVWIDDFEISKYEVTWEEYQAFINAGGYRDRRNNGFWSRKGADLAEVKIWSIDDASGLTLDGTRWTPEGSGPKEMRDQHRWPPQPKDPVMGVSYWEAEAFCRFVGGRLPSEAEWEKAASWGPTATAPRTFPWGESTSTPLPGNAFEVSEGFSVIATVDNPRYAGDKSAYGVCGMGGNVREWVADMFDPGFYSQGPGGTTPWKNPLDFQARRFDYTDTVGGHLPIEWTIRGGHFMNVSTDATPFRCSTREHENPFFRSSTLGFRVAWDTRPKPQSTPVERTDRPGAAVHIPGGTYEVGHTIGMPSDTGASGDENPQHEICLNPYWVGEYEVTWYEYKKFMDLGGYGDPRGPKPAWWSDEGWRWRINPPGSGGVLEYSVSHPDLLGQDRPILGVQRFVPWKGPWEALGAKSSPPGDHPVMSISWYEADAYCHFVGGRLPKEVEWEVAATWNPSTDRPMIYPWGNLQTFPTAITFGNSGDDPKYQGYQTSPVGMYPDGKSQFGCYDMSGNVFEWTSDWYNPASYSTHDSRCGGNISTPDTMKLNAPVLAGYTPVPGFKVNRGGGYDPAFQNAFSQRGRTRGVDGAQGFRANSFGVRVVWDQNPASLPNAQRVRPPYITGTDDPPQAPAPTKAVSKSLSISEDIIPGLVPVEAVGTMDLAGRDYLYRVMAPPGTWVEVNLDANGGSDNQTRYSPLDAQIEIWRQAFDSPVRTLDDEVLSISDVNHRDYFMDPPPFQFETPEEGYFVVRVKAYSWPAEGSQAGLTEGERSYTGPDYTFKITFTSHDLPCYDLNQDGVVDTGDLISMIEGFKARGSQRLKADLNSDKSLSSSDMFALEVLWSHAGDRCATTP